MTQLSCGHSKWDARRDCVTCLLAAIDALNAKLTEERIAGTSAGRREDILAILKETLPYYESDDKDDFIYLAKADDLAVAALRISSHLRAASPPVAGTSQKED